MTRTPITASLLVILTAGTLLSACKKSNSAFTGVSATIDSINFQSGTVNALYYTTFGQFSISAYANTSPGSALIVSFSPPFKLNVPISSDPTTPTSFFYNKDSLNYQGTSPNGLGHVVVTVTAYDASRNTIAGTFSGFLINTADRTDTLPVTNGKFNVTYKDEN